MKRQNSLAKVALLRSQRFDAGSALAGGLAGAGAGYMSSDEDRMRNTFFGGLAGAGAGYAGRKVYSAQKQKKMYRSGSKRSRNIYDDVQDKAYGTNMPRDDKPSERKAFFDQMRRNKNGPLGEDTTKEINKDMLDQLKKNRKNSGKYFKQNVDYKKGQPGYQSESRARADVKDFSMDFSFNKKRPKHRVNDSSRSKATGWEGIHASAANMGAHARAAASRGSYGGQRGAASQKFRSSPFDNAFKGKSEGEVKKHYRTEARKHHPDAGGNEADFKDLNEAYNKAMHMFAK